MTLKYTTVDLLKAFKINGSLLNLGGYSTDELAVNLQIAENIVENYTGTIFYSFTATKLFSGRGTQCIYFANVQNYPIVSASTCTEVNDKGDLLRTFTEGIDFTLEPWFISKTWQLGTARDITASQGPAWRVGSNNIKIVGTWGRSTVPPEVMRGTLLLAAELSKSESTGLARSNISKQKWEDYAVEYAGGTQNPPAPSETTGFPFVDMLLVKYRTSPDLFLTPDEPTAETFRRPHVSSGIM